MKAINRLYFLSEMHFSSVFGQVRSRTVGYRRLPARTAVVNRIAGIILGVISITVQANPFQVLRIRLALDKKSFW